MAKYLHDKGTDRLLRDIADAKPAALSVSYEQDDAGNTRFIVNDNAPHSHAKAERIAAILAAALDSFAALQSVMGWYDSSDIAHAMSEKGEQAEYYRTIREARSAIARAGGAA